MSRVRVREVYTYILYIHIPSFILFSSLSRADIQQGFNCSRPKALYIHSSHIITGKKNFWGGGGGGGGGTQLELSGSPSAYKPIYCYICTLK